VKGLGEVAEAFGLSSLVGRLAQA